MSRIDNIQSQFGKAVRNARTARGISQEQLADLSGLDRSYIGGVERGERNLSILAIDKIAHGLEISISDLLKGLRSERRGATRGGGS